DELPGEARLAYARLAHDGDDLAATRPGEGEGLVELIHFDLTPHEAGEPSRGGSVEARADDPRAKEIVDLHRRREPLDGNGTARAHLHIALGDLERSRREEDRARLRDRVE